MNSCEPDAQSYPPQMIMRVPVQTILKPWRVLSGDLRIQDQDCVDGRKRIPVPFWIRHELAPQIKRRPGCPGGFDQTISAPPHTYILFPVQTARGL